LLTIARTNWTASCSPTLVRRYDNSDFEIARSTKLSPDIATAMVSDRPRAAKREAPSSQRCGRHHKKPKTLHNAAEFRDKRASKKKGKTDKKERVQEDPKARSKH